MGNSLTTNEDDLFLIKDSSLCPEVTSDKKSTKFQKKSAVFAAEVIANMKLACIFKNNLQISICLSTHNAETGESFIYSIFKNYFGFWQVDKGTGFKLTENGNINLDRINYIENGYKFDPWVLDHLSPSEFNSILYAIENLYNAPIHEVLDSTINFMDEL